MIEGGRVFFDAAAQCLYEECGAAGSVREDFCLGQRVLRQEAFRADAATGKVFFVRHPLLTCAPQKSAGERTQGTHALEVRSSEIGFGRAESPEAFAPADSSLGKRRTSGRFLLVFPFMEEKRRNAPSPMADEGFLFRQFNPLNRFFAGPIAAFACSRGRSLIVMLRRTFGRAQPQDAPAKSSEALFRPCGARTIDAGP